MIEIQVIASGSKGNCYRVTDGNTPLLIECGIRFPAIRQALNFATSSIAGCLVSHEHGDHAKAIKEVMRAGIDCYMSRGTADALGLSGHRLKIITAGKQFRIGSWTIMPFDAVHDAAEPLSFLLASGREKLLFATDTAYIRYRFRGLTHIMVECNYQPEILRANIAEGVVSGAQKKRLLRSHFSLDNVLGFLAANDLSAVREIWLLHLSDHNSDAGAMLRAVQAATGRPVVIA